MGESLKIKNEWQPPNSNVNCNVKLDRYKITTY